MHLMNKDSSKNLLIPFKTSTIKRLIFLISFLFFCYQTFVPPTLKDSGQKETLSQDDLWNSNPENVDNDVF